MCGPFNHAQVFMSSSLTVAFQACQHIMAMNSQTDYALKHVNCLYLLRCISFLVIQEFSEQIPTWYF